MLLTDRSVLIGMETPTAIILLRYGLAITGLLWLFMQLHWRRRLAWPSSLMLLVWVGALSLSTPHSQMLFRVLVLGPDAYSPTGLLRPYGSLLQLETAAYANAFLHLGLAAFFVAFALSRRVRDYLQWGNRAAS